MSSNKKSHPYWNGFFLNIGLNYFLEPNKRSSIKKMLMKSR